MKDSGISVLQLELHLLNFSASESLLTSAARRQVSIIAREPFAQGRLIPPLTEIGTRSGFLGESYDQRFDVLGVPGSRTVPQAALQFLLQCPTIAATLVGMSNRGHLYENTKATLLTPPTDMEWAEISRQLGMKVSQNP